LLAARDGTLWIGTYAGLVSWKDDNLSQYPQLAGLEVGALVEDREGTVWAGTGYQTVVGKLCSIRRKIVQCVGDGRFGNAVYSLYEDKAGTLWVGAVNGLWRWKPGPPKFFPTPDRILSLGESDDGKLLLLMRDGIEQVVDGTLKAYVLPSSGLLELLFRDRDGGLWIGMQHGLLHVHRGNTDTFMKSDGLSGEVITAIFEDREGNVWAATNNGLDRFRELVAVPLSAKQGFAEVNRTASVLAGRDGSVWTSNSDLLNRWREGQVTIYRGNRKGRSNGPEERSTGAPVREVIDPSLQGEIMGSLFEDHRGRIWASTIPRAVYFKNDHFVPLNSTAPCKFIHSFAEDSGGDIWISAHEFLCHLHDDRVVEQISWARLGTNDFAETLVGDAVRGGLWLGLFKGGVQYFKDGQIRASYSSTDGLGEGRVNSLRLDRNGAIWAATVSGLSRIQNGRVTTLSRKNGLPCDNLEWAIEDDTHSLWLDMACGLVRIPRAELDAWEGDSERTVHVTVFDSSDGVKSHSFYISTTPHVAKSPDGKIWFTNLDGLSFVDPRRLPTNKLAPQVHIEKIAADDKTYDDPSNGLRLPPLVRDVTIDYTALSLVAPEKMRFRYKLEGQDTEWREGVNDRQVQYSNLPPSHYRFRVIASNNSGVWNKQGATLDFIIPPAWYQTNWFWALCAAAFAALLWGLYRQRVRHLRQKMEEQEEKFREAVQSMPAMAFVAGPDGNRTFVNDRWLAYTGYSLQQALGSGWQSAIHRDDRERVIEKWRASLNSGEPLEYELRLRGVDGQYRWFLTRAVPVHNARGKIVKWYGTATDIEDRKRAEDALRHSEMYLAEAQTLTHSGSWVVDGKTHEILFFSEEMFRIFGFDVRNGLPTREQCYSRIYSEDHEKLRQASEEIFLRKRDMDTEYRILLPDGTSRHLHSLAKPVFDHNGYLVEVVGTTVDITERKRAEEDRERLHQLEADLAHFSRVSMLGEMAATLAHEIKQPIAAAITSANTCVRWLERQPPELTRARAAAMRVEKDGTRAAQIIDHLRALYKKSPPQRELVDVNGLVEGMLILLGGEAARHSVSMHTELLESLPGVTADRVQVQQVLMNLMLNGMEAMKDNGGELTIRTEMATDLVLVTVRDTGVGLPKEQADRIFDAFFTTKPNGTGMGLAISRSIIESHGGRLWAAASNGRGAIFHFTLPLQP
ncbi:MAG: PAS domain-containing protein, partial [Silvibacterium sp.]|nr:PAS domain-containing protein [Silvibacterium sp.]